MVQPHMVDALVARAHEHWSNHRLSEAQDCFEQVLQLDSSHVDVWYGIGRLRSLRGDDYGAEHAYREALQRTASHDKAYDRLARLYCERERWDDAVQVVRDWLRAHPHSAPARHMLASLTQESGSQVPPRAPDAYVSATFDDLAVEFDSIMARVDYCAPLFISMALERELGAPRGELDVLDAGCGTGLCAPELRPYARTLAGADISPAMVAQANARAVYDELSVTELTNYLESTARSFDVVVAADVLVYFGDLEPVLGAAAGALRVGGVLVATVELWDQAGDRDDDSRDDRGFRLSWTGRYSHREPYVVDALRAAGFSSVQTVAASLRTEGGEPVANLIVSARRGA